MNPNIEKLYRIAQKPQRLIIGLMSGTSLDGLDVALCRFTGSGMHTKATVLQFETVAYDEDFKAEVREVFAKTSISLEQLCLLHPWIARRHAAIVNHCLDKWNLNAADVDLVASHGQTVFHAPKQQHKKKKFGNATLQIGDGDHLAVETGIITISDFRQKHIAAGGEGAPLAAYGDHLLFSKEEEDRILLNIGGIANFTFLPASGNFNEMVSSDSGPGNTLMDAYIREQSTGTAFDRNGELAASGSPDQALLNELQDDPFFRLPFPKTTGPELFNLEYLGKALQKSVGSRLTPADIMATLNRFTAETIARAIRELFDGKNNTTIYLSGGGIHNPVLIAHLENLMPGHKIISIAELGIHPDAKESVLFAALANECICGEETPGKERVKAMPGVALGKISFPA